MLYYKLPFSLSDDLESIKKGIGHLLGTNEVIYPLIDHETLCQRTVTYLEDKLQSKLLKARIFITPPWTTGAVHLDGYNFKLCTKWAINIPIMGCEDTAFEFFEVNERIDAPIKNHEYSVSSSFFGHDIKKKLGSITMIEPHIVRTDVPHRAVNQKSTPRVILSLRFETSQTTEMQEIIRMLGGYEDEVVYQDALLYALYP